MIRCNNKTNETALTGSQREWVMNTTCPGCKEEISPAHVKDFVKQADGSYVVWHNACNSNRLAAEKSERLHKAETRVAELERQLSEIHASARRMSFAHEWYIEGVRTPPGDYVLMRLGPASSDEPVF